MGLDDKDKKLLRKLQMDGRASLTTLAKIVSLSIDSTNKRIKKLYENGTIGRFSVFIDPKKAGYDLVANVQIKLQNVSEKELNEFLSYLKEHPNVTSLLTTLGHFDFTCVIIAKNTQELEKTYLTIRHKFKDLIADWQSVINLKCYKFEEYAFD
ncbi:hypothetical protein COV18_03820 [Candidatus Woesearchaeota archaeon CG10_big_fil_rev_8_21_14_0_10_37_12]|nr:MAG: hypothetical protein COV18_03820 [Candidatus Woesearchaeota archaeon CG10_big_fil_rev_8_21_14_0_10_37_12]